MAACASSRARAAAPDGAPFPPAAFRPCAVVVIVTRGADSSSEPSESSPRSMLDAEACSDGDGRGMQKCRQQHLTTVHSKTTDAVARSMTEAISIGRKKCGVSKHLESSCMAICAGGDGGEASAWDAAADRPSTDSGQG